MNPKDRIKEYLDKKAEIEKEYLDFLETKRKRRIESGFDADINNEKMFDFQKYCVKRALKAGKFALFEDCGMGKSFQQLEWSQQVTDHTDKPVLILAPLGVVPQTVQEGGKFGYIVKN